MSGSHRSRLATGFLAELTQPRVRQPVHQIGAAIPFRALRRIRLPRAVAKEQQFPPSDDKALIERKRKLVGARGYANGLPRHQIRVQRAVVLIADIGEMIVGKGRVQMPAAAIDASAHESLLACTKACR